MEGKPKGHTDWGQWDWADTGPGHWHAIVDAGVGITGDLSAPVVTVAVNLACGRVRSLPSRVEHDPPREDCCRKCLALHDLKERLDTHAPVDVDPTYSLPKETVPA